MRDGNLLEGMSLLPAQSRQSRLVVAVVVTWQFRCEPALSAFRIGRKEAVEWFKEGLPATAEEVEAARASAGLP